jgi:putative membrane protein
MGTMNNFDLASFSDLWSPWVFVIAIGIAVLYFYKLGKYESQVNNGGRVPMRQKACFIAGLGVFYLAQGSPLNFLSHHYLFSAHMMQQSLILFVMPPLILFGLPAGLIKGILDVPWIKKMLPIAVHPILAVVVFNSLLSFYHFPFIYDWLMSDRAMVFGTLYHAILMLSAFQMWWVIVGPLPELDRLSELLKVTYIVINGLLLYPACALIIFANDLIYTTYAHAPQLTEWLSPMDDQQLGGVIMKIMQEGVFVIALALLFKKWYRRENVKEAI